MNQSDKNSSLDRNELLAQAEELAERIVQSPEVAAYQFAQQKLKQNPAAVALLKKVQEIQAQLTEFQARNVPPMHYAYLLKESETLLYELNTIPEVTALKEAEQHVNSLLELISSRLMKIVTEDPNTETPHEIDFK